MISKKMQELGRCGSVIREIFEYSKKRKAEIGDNKVFDFSIGNPSIPTPEAFRNTLIDLLGNQDQVELHSYTADVGNNSVRKTLADNIKKRYGFNQTSDLIYMTCGASSSLSISLKALLEDGDEVILLPPYFPEYKVFVENAGGVVKTALCDSESFQPDIENIAEALSDKTRAIIINSPCNPTGAVYTREILKKISALLSSQNHPIYIIADEPYRALAYDNVEIPYIPNLYKNTVVCTSYSKSLSIPGARIGYIALSPECDYAEDFFAAICGAGRSMGYICAPSVFQKAVALCDTLPSDVSFYDRNRRLLYESLTEIGYTCVMPEGAFYLFVKALEEDANEFCIKAREQELLLVPSDSFGVGGWVRIAYCTSHEQIENSIPAFKKLYESYKVR